jgi:hypothetical protein
MVAEHENVMLEHLQQECLGNWYCNSYLRAIVVSDIEFFEGTQIFVDVRGLRPIMFVR